MSIDIEKIKQIKSKPVPQTDNIFRQVDATLQKQGINNKQFQNLRKHNQASINITPERESDFVELRARNQSTFDRIGNVIAQTFGEFVGGSIEGFGSLISFFPKVFGDKEAYTRNWLEQLGNSINENTREAFPIYMTKQAQSNSLLERMKGGGYWAQLLPSVFGSAASIMLPARGASMLLGKAGKFAIEGLSKYEKAKKLFKLAEGVQKNKALSRMAWTTDVLGSAITSRVLDSSREASQAYQEQKQWFLDNYDRFVERDENGNAILKLNNGEIPATEANIERMAHEYADRAASRGYWMSMSNIMYDMIEWTGIMGASHSIARGLRKQIGKTMGTADEFALARTLQAIPEAGSRNILGNAARFAYGSAAEMADEMQMSISMKEGARLAKEHYGFLGADEEYIDFGDRLIKYLSDPDILTEGIGGLLGGAGMQLVMPYIERKLNKNGIKQEEAYLASMKQAFSAMRDGIDGIAIFLADGDLISARQQLRTAVVNQVAANTLDGSLEFYEEMLENMDKSMQKLKDIKQRKDANQEISADEQMFLDKGNELLETPDVFREMLNQIKEIKPIFERNFNAIPANLNGDRATAAHELARRKAVYEAHKHLNNKELEYLENKNNEYNTANDAANSHIDSYLNNASLSEENKASKRTGIETYARSKKRLSELQLQETALNNVINNIKDKISSIDKQIDEISKKDSSEISEKDKAAELDRLKKERLNHQQAIEIYKKQLGTPSSKKADGSTNEATGLISLIEAEKNVADSIENLNNEDKKIADEAANLMSNKIDKENLRKQLQMSNAIIDAQLNHLNSNEAFTEVMEDINTYNTMLKNKMDDELRNKLDSYKTSKELEAARKEFETSEETKKAYEDKLKALKLNEKREEEHNNRTNAAIAEKQKEEVKEALSQRGISINFENTSKKIEHTSLPDNLLEIVNKLRNEALEAGKDITDYVKEEFDKNPNDSTLEDLNNYFQQLNNEFTSSFDGLHNTVGNQRIIPIIYDLLKDYIQYTKENGISKISTIKQIINIWETLNNTTFNYNNESNILEVLVEYVKAINIYVSTTHDSIPAIFIENKLGPSATNDTIKTFADTIYRKAKYILKKFDDINTILNDLNNDVYVRIDGIEYKVIDTEDSTIKDSIALEGISQRINRYYLNREDAIEDDNNFVIISRPKSSAPFHTYSPTGSLKAQQGTSNQINNQNNSTVPTTNTSNTSNTSNISNISNQDENGHESANNNLILDEKSKIIIFNFSNDVVLSSEIEDLLISNFDIVKDVLKTPNTLAFLLSLMNNRTANLNMKNIINKLINKEELNENEKLLINVADEINDILYIDLDNKYIRPYTDLTDYTLTRLYTNIEKLFSLYDGAKAINNFNKDFKEFKDIIDNLYELANITKQAQVLLGLEKVDPNYTSTMITSLLKEQSEAIILGLKEGFDKNINLIFNLISFINDQQGFKLNIVNMYDIVTAIRMFKGDNAEDIYDTIINAVDTAIYVKKSLRSKLYALEDKFNKSKGQDKDMYRKAYQNYKVFYDMLDIDTENNYNDLVKIDNLTAYIQNTPIIGFSNGHVGLDIHFDINDSPNYIFDNHEVDNLGIYEVLSLINVGDDVTLVRVDNSNSTNEAMYDIMYTDKTTSKQYKLGSIPALKTISNGIVYVTKGKNNVHYIRKFNFDDTNARIIAEYQNILYQFMYNYSIVNDEYNNVSENSKNAAEKWLASFYENIKKDHYAKLRNVFKEIAYGNLSNEEIKNIVENHLTGVLNNNTNYREGTINTDELPLGLNQMYQICRDMFDGVVLSKAKGIGNKSYKSIINTFEKSVSRQQSIFRHNIGLRGDIEASDNMTMKITNIGAGSVIINEKSKKEENESRRGIGLGHSRNAILETLAPSMLMSNDSTDEGFMIGRPQILYINEDGFASDLKTGFGVDAVSFSTPHAGSRFLGHRKQMVAVVKQTDKVYTVFPIKPNTIMGSITDNSMDARRERLSKYNEYISDRIISILNLTFDKAAIGRETIIDELQDIIICNENDSELTYDINFKTFSDHVIKEDGTDDSYIAVMFKSTYGPNAKPMYHKLIKKNINGKDVIAYYSDENRVKVANFNGSMNNPDYKGTHSFILKNDDGSINDEQLVNLKNLLYTNIPYLTRQFGYDSSKGVAVSKKSSPGNRTDKYISPVTGNTYDSIYDYYMKSNAIYTDLAAIKNSQGKAISNVTVSGANPIKFSIGSKEFDDPNAEATQTFYSAVDGLKAVQGTNTFKEDWKSISEIETILEEDAGVKPIYVIHKVSEINNEEGSASPRKVQDNSDYLPLGFNYNSYRIDLYYNLNHMRKFGNANYLTKTLAHEMLHTFMMKHFNITSNQLSNKEIRDKKEALIQYNNEEITKWVDDFIKSVNAIRQKINDNLNLTTDENFVKRAIDAGLVDQLITIFTNEIDTVSNKINGLLKDRANGLDTVLNGQCALQEPIVYALTQPVVHKLLNSLQSISEREAGAENNKPITIWQKLLNVLKNIFTKVFGYTESETKEHSSLERLMDAINKIYKEDFKSIDATKLTVGASLNYATPDRARVEDRSETSEEVSKVVNDIEQTNDTANEQTTEQKNQYEEDDDIDLLDVNESTDDDIKESKPLNISESLTKSLFDNNDILNKNINFDETKRILC